MTYFTDNIITRRGFLGRLGGGMAAMAIAGCRRAATTAGVTTANDPVDEGMTYRTTPTTGDKVSLLGFGCMRFPFKENPDGTKSDSIDQEEVNRLIDHALANGVNYFDTSPAYCKGLSEGATGKALSRHSRDSYFIATKLSNFSPETQSRAKSIEMFEHSLSELQTDYVDYLLLHGVGMGGMDSYYSRYVSNGILDYLLEQKAKGRIRNLGFSYHGDVEVFDYLLGMHDRGEVKWDFVQIQLNYIDWHHAKEINPRNTNAEYLYTELANRGIPAVIMEPLLGGRLGAMPDHLAARMKQRRPDDSVASWAFRFAGSHPMVLTVLSGMTRMDHLKENLATYSPLVPCTDEEKSFLEDTAELYLSMPIVACTDCNYCMPCPYGIDIPSIFAFYNTCLNEGKIVSSAGNPDYRKARRAFLADYSRKIMPERQADHCIGCGQCLVHCPQGINIPDELHRIDRFAEQLRQNKA